ncbi:DUF167 domain-containing protein [Candidatus Formimonas warabiya]|uniref:UPF0235 protein DCMF_09315 n=1 Tax=Formimonas warabiya TaxID=1761012 RepID=A0A3G1KS29_FORW1|nr:DUF167 domain-containing protein [Candidatus Formimonas warabiya]ATW24945.1 YggU family protein [Candidatus Formimonas warabiya]
MIDLVDKGNRIAFKVKVQPRASKSEIAGIIGDAVKLRITSPPVDGAANEAVIRFFADLFRKPAKDIAIISGLLSRNKIVEISGLSLSEAKKAFQIE